MPSRDHLSLPAAAPRALLGRAEMQAFDRAAIDGVGIPAMVLMESAGRAVAEATLRLSPKRVLVLAGTGNNGGDGLVAARWLRNSGVEVTIAIAEGRPSDDFEQQKKIAVALGLPILSVRSGNALEIALAGHDTVIDALFGTGLQRPLAGLFAELVERLNQSGLKVGAVDLPSGVDATTGQALGVAVEADVTVTFGLPKIGLALHPGRALAGRVEVVDIGIPYSLLPGIGPTVFLVQDELIARAIPPRRADSHKGTYGHLLVIAGMPDRPGAALLSARAALKAGAGLVTLGSTAEVVRRLAPALVEVMGFSLGDALDLGSARLAAQACSALAIGPSLAPDASLSRFVRELVEPLAIPVVIDAGGLDALRPDPSWLASRSAPTILTPHPGEAARLLGIDTKQLQSDRIGSARRLAAWSGAEVVLKGSSTVIASPNGEAHVLLAGNPGMAKGGMGDVLTGVTGALLAQRIGAPTVARLAPLLHARAGDRAAARVGEAPLVASDLLDELRPEVP